MRKSPADSPYVLLARIVSHAHFSNRHWEEPGLAYKVKTPLRAGTGLFFPKHMAVGRGGHWNPIRVLRGGKQWGWGGTQQCRQQRRKRKIEDWSCRETDSEKKERKEGGRKVGGNGETDSGSSLNLVS